MIRLDLSNMLYVMDEGLALVLSCEPVSMLQGVFFGRIPGSLLSHCPLRAVAMSYTAQGFSSSL